MCLERPAVIDDGQTRDGAGDVRSAGRAATLRDRRETEADAAPPRASFVDHNAFLILSREDGQRQMADPLRSAHRNIGHVFACARGYPGQNDVAVRHEGETVAGTEFLVEAGKDDLGFCPLGLPKVAAAEARQGDLRTIIRLPERLIAARDGHDPSVIPLVPDPQGKSTIPKSPASPGCCKRPTRAEPAGGPRHPRSRVARRPAARRRVASSSQGRLR